jgi:hypothetical protein
MTRFKHQDVLERFSRDAMIAISNKTVKVLGPHLARRKTVESLPQEEWEKLFKTENFFAQKLTTLVQKILKENRRQDALLAKTNGNGIQTDPFQFAKVMRSVPKSWRKKSKNATS